MIYSYTSLYTKSNDLFSNSYIFFFLGKSVFSKAGKINENYEIINIDNRFSFSGKIEIGVVTKTQRTTRRVRGLDCWLNNIIIKYVYNVCVRRTVSTTMTIRWPRRTTDLEVGDDISRSRGRVATVTPQTTFIVYRLFRSNVLSALCFSPPRSGGGRRSQSPRLLRSPHQSPKFNDYVWN